MRKEIPLLITLLTGLVYIFSTFFNIKAIASAKSTLDNWFLVTTAFACAVGLINLTLIHLRSVSTRRSGWGYSLVLLAAMYGILIYGTFTSASGKFYQNFLFLRMLSPLSATMFSLLVFYITSAAYRSFRVRSFEATLLLVTAVIIMLGRAPIGDLISPILPKAASWLMDIPNNAGMRGILIGATLGGVATALRVLVGIERSYLAGE